MLEFKSVKTQLILYLVCFAVFLAVNEKNATLLVALIIAVAASLTVESIILYFKTKFFQITESSIITGLIIGFVLFSYESWWKLIVASVLAIIFKYLIRLQRKHIFNPAGLGIFLTLIFFGASSQWKGTYFWQIILPFGLYFSYKLKKIGIIMGYVLVSLTLFGIQAVSHQVDLWHIFGYLSYFYIFIMVIEPKTTPIKKTGQLFFGACLAGLIFILTNLGVKFDIELFSLLVMNTTVPLLNKLTLKKGGV